MAAINLPTRGTATYNQPIILLTRGFGKKALTFNNCYHPAILDENWYRNMATTKKAGTKTTAPTNKKERPEKTIARLLLLSINMISTKD